MFNLKKKIKLLIKFIGDNFFHSIVEIERKKRINKFNLFYKFQEENFEKCYNHFKKHFYSAVLLNDNISIRKYSINTALKNCGNLNNLFLEFGVATGNSINFISNLIGKKEIYGFDSFYGNREDFIGNKDRTAGAWNMGGIIPKVNKNVKIIKGEFQKTLEKFLKENENLQISFVHIDCNTYESTKFVLDKIKPKLSKGCVILFDELYNMPNWEYHEYKALTEVFSESEYKFIAFSAMHEVAIEIL